MAALDNMRRLSIDLPEEEFEKLQELIPYGLRNRIMRVLVNSMLNVVDQYGDIVFGALLTGKISALDLIKKGGETSGLIGPKGGIEGYE